MAVLQEFRYRAIDPRGGAIVRGTLEAATEAAVTSKLKAQGLTPLEVVEVSKTGLNMEIKVPGLTKHVKAKSLAIFSKQMAGLINAGLPLMRTLSILIEQSRRIVLSFLDFLNSGWYSLFPLSLRSTPTTP
jgi:type IV pilus assembly protein PilC